jgi:hypothetical protein
MELMGRNQCWPITLFGWIELLVLILITLKMKPKAGLIQELELELELKKLFGGEKWYGTGGKLASNCWFQTRLPKTKYDFHNQNQICNPS